jgi:RNA polymerase subunit RPABC4/transcription elongation factor Spt4
MVQCQNCGNVNNYGSNFCRFCGTKMVHGNQPPQQQYPPQPAPPPLPQQQQDHSYEFNPPRPYSWKTDEFQAPSDTKTRKSQNEINRVQPLSNFNQPQPLVHQQNAAAAYGYRCPRCGTQNLPVMTRKISTAGWIVFSVLLIFTFFFFWIGLLMKEDVRTCPVCGLQIN